MKKFINAETIKLYIKQAKETLGITYVMLVGGHIGQTHDWHLPVRYGHSQSEDAYLSDLYYADLYKYVDNETVFEDWDSNGNGEYAEYAFAYRDIIDGSPDVYVGRLACRDVSEVDIIVSKIIAYESEPADDSWFKTFVLIGGDTYPDKTDYYDGEVYNQMALDMMDGFEPVKCEICKEVFLIPVS